MGLDISFFKLKSRSKIKKHLKEHSNQITYSLAVFWEELDKDYQNNQLTKLMYFRKVNFIVAYYQDQLIEDSIAVLTKKDLEDLLEATEEVLKDPSNASNILPTVSGFFFGSTNYDEYYFEDVKYVNESLKKALKKVKDTDIIYLDCSW